MILRSGRFIGMSKESADQEKIDQWIGGLAGRDTPKDPGSFSRQPSCHDTAEIRSNTGSAKSSSSTHSVRMKEAQVKLKLARLRKDQNVARYKEDQPLAELRHRISIAEDERRVEAAEVEVSVWQMDDLASNEDMSLIEDPKFQADDIHRRTENWMKSNNVASTKPDVEDTVLPVKPPCKKEEAIKREYVSLTSDRQHGHEPKVPPTPSHQYGGPYGYDPYPENSRWHQWPYLDYGSRPEERLSLPKPEIKRFEGNPLDYGAFLNRFKAHVSDNLPNSKKMTYLLQYCNDKVREQIQHYADNQRERPGCYDLAWRELKRRYGEPHIIAQACEERLLNLPSFSQIDPERLGKMSVLMNRCCSALENVPGASSLDTVHFISLLVNKLPFSAREEWVKFSVTVSDDSKRVATFRDLTNFVLERARIANSVFGLKMFALQSTKSSVTKPDMPPRKNKVAAFTTASTADDESHKVLNKAVEKTVKCLLCEGTHFLQQCGKFCSKSYNDKWDFLRQRNLCKLCLKPGHMSRQCKSSNVCKKRSCGSQYHHTLLHPPDLAAGVDWKPRNQNGDSNKIKGGEWLRINDSNDVKNDTDSKANNYSVTMLHSVRAYLDIVPVNVSCNGRTVATYALLDSGSDRSFCKRQLITELNVEPSSQCKIALQTLSSDRPKMVETRVVSLDLFPLEGGTCMTLNNVIVLDKIPVQPSPIPEAAQIKRWPQLRDVHIPRIDNGQVTMLIGNDHTVAHRCVESRFSSEPAKSPDAIRTPLGWLLRGKYLQNGPTSSGVSNFLVRGLNWSSDVEDLRNLIVIDEGEMFPLDAGSDLYDKEEFIRLLFSHKEMLEFGAKFALQDPIAYDVMRRKLCHEDGYYVLPLLWRNDAEKLPSSQEMDMSRLNSLKKRLLRDNVLRERNVDQMEGLISKGYAEEVPPDEIDAATKEWYLPHHPVLNSKKPDKVRIVYDCAATAHGHCLNDFLMKGPDLMNSLVGVLLRFRKGPIAIVSDIQ